MIFVQIIQIVIIEQVFIVNIILSVIVIVNKQQLVLFLVTTISEIVHVKQLTVDVLVLKLLPVVLEGLLVVGSHLFEGGDFGGLHVLIACITFGNEVVLVSVKSWGHA